MNMDSKLQIGMSQRLVMTPMLQQAIKLLQMSRLELVDLVKQELLENPILDTFEDGEDDLRYQAEVPEASPAETLTDSQQLRQVTVETETLEREPREHPKDEAINWDDYFEDNPAGLGYYNDRDAGEPAQSYEQTIRQPQTLADHLAWQLQMSQLPECDMKIGTFLIGQIDEDGYIRCDDEPCPFAVGLQKADLSAPHLAAYRTHVVEVLQPKVNAMFERDYLLSKIAVADTQGVLARTILQEYYDDLICTEYDVLMRKLHYFTLEDLETIAQFLSELSPDMLEALTRVPAAEIASGLKSIAAVCQNFRRLLEHHFAALSKHKHAIILEKTGLSAEDLFLVEYLLSRLSPEEVAYIAGKETPSKAAKREKEVRTLLEKLRQSYAHITSLQSHKYFLIQLYTIGVSILLEHLQTTGATRFSKVFLKLLNITEDDIKAVTTYLSTLRERYAQQTVPVSTEEVERVLRHIQTFAPPGIGARDVKECLTIQARNLGITDTPVEPIITNYLSELKQKQYTTIATHLNISVEDVELVEKIISNMSPKPGADFSTAPPEYIVPDIYVYNIGGEYEVILNEDDLPYLRINPVYKKLLRNDHRVPDSTRQYIDQKLRSATWFIRSIEQRKRTIHKVGKSIIKFQKAFLEYGISHLKPLVLRDVADDIAMHESTVSRVTANKYIHTPQGVFELKFFFHSGLGSSSGHDVSSIAVKERIKNLIADENGTQPLSDQDIEDILQHDGIAIARRTIAKYREELSIPSSIQRKRV